MEQMPFIVSRFRFFCYLIRRYLGVATESSLDPDLSAMPKARDTVVYRWSFRACGVAADKKVSVKYNNIKGQGVPLPDGWQIAFRALALPKIAQRSAAKASADVGHRCFQCKVLGTALPLPELKVSLGEEQAGSLVVFSGHGGRRLAGVLCAHVQGAQWLYYPCGQDHPANAIDGADLVLDRVDSAARADPTEAELDKMVNLIRSNHSSFSRVFAEAAWRAEEQRASLRGIPVDLDVAAVGYEANPFLWQHGIKEHVCIVWSSAVSPKSSAAAGEEAEPSKFAWHRLGYILSEGWSSQPPRSDAALPLQIQAQELRARLEEKAEEEYRGTGCACGYLGVLVQGHGDAWTDKFEPDPAKWPAMALQAADQWDRIIVWYEWKYATKGPDKKPLRASQRLEHAIGRLQKKMIAEIDTGRCFAFRDLQGEQHVFTGVEVLRMLRNMEICGTSKYQSASALLSWLQEWVATGDGKQYCGQPEHEEVAKAHLQEVMAELEAIASMKGVDLLIDGTDEFMDRLREGQREEMELTAAILRESLRNFLSVSSAHENKLRTCYSAVDAALGNFQHALADDPADATITSARAMDGLSTIGIQGSPVHFKPGTRIVLRGLRSRPEQGAFIVSVPTASQPRYGVELLSTKERILVKVEKVHASIFAGDPDVPS